MRKSHRMKKRCQSEISDGSDIFFIAIQYNGIYNFCQY